MKKLYVAILMLLMFAISSCSFTKDKVVYIHDNSFKSLREENFINNVMELDVGFEDVSLGSDEEFLNYINEMSEKKNKSLYVISERFENLDVSGYLDNYIYLNNDINDNMRNLTIDQTKINYLLGIISGMYTRTNNVGVLYSSKYSDLNEEFTSFIEGVKVVNPRAYDSLIDGVNTLDVDSVDENGIEDFMKNNKSDVIFNLSSLEVTNDEKIVLTNGIKDEEFINIFYDYDTVIGDIQKNNSEDYVIDITNNVNVNLTNFPEEILNEVYKHMNLILN